jgi:hypothetical protein
MRSWLAVAAIVVLVAAPAQAQMGGVSGRNRGGEKPADQKKPQLDEKAYKAALDRIPEPKEKYDPWGGARPAPQDKTKAK